MKVLLHYIHAFTRRSESPETDSEHNVESDEDDERDDDDDAASTMCVESSGMACRRGETHDYRACTHDGFYVTYDDDDVCNFCETKKTTSNTVLRTAGGV